MQVFLHICAIFLIIAFYEGFFSALIPVRFFVVYERCEGGVKKGEER